LLVCWHWQLFQIVAKKRLHKVADAQFIMLSTDPATANFSLKATSPAINAGTQTLFAAKDFTGNGWPGRTTVDCGSYEIIILIFRRRYNWQ